MQRRTVSRLCLYLVAIGFVATGLLYMFYGSPMPYHLKAMQVDWAEIPAHQQLVITAIQRGAASGFLAGGIAIAMLTWFALGTASESWARGCVLLIGLIETLPAIYSVRQLQAHTPGDPPLGVLLAFLALLLLGVTGSTARRVGS